jgi:integrase/recombinase XerD
MESFGVWLYNTPTRKGKRRDELTLEAYLRDVKLFGLGPDQLSHESLMTYLGQFESKPNTYNRKLASMRMLIRWARLEGLIDHDPAAWIPFLDAIRESPRDKLPEERMQLEATVEAGLHLRKKTVMHSVLGLRDQVIFELMNDAGLRENEVAELRLDDLHLDEGYIHVLGKGDKHRKVRIGSGLKKTIESWLDRKPASVEGTLITDWCGRAICRVQVWKRFKMIAKAAGVDARPHDMRHTYMYRFMDAIMAGDEKRLPVALDAASQQTGDRPEVILQYYTRARESDMRTAVEGL